jgi:NAD+ diphosphatase
LQLKVEMHLKLSLGALHARRGTGSQTSHFLGLTLQVRLVYKDLSPVILSFLMAVVIMVIVSHDTKRVLLGRKKRWPQYRYSALAGFCEPAESVEDAVRREVWEESGVLVGRVVIHSTQPWPYPANLMIGAIAQALLGGEEILLKHDPELEDAKWVDWDEIREALRVGASGPGEAISEEYKEGSLRLPPKTAIANQLLTAVVGGFLGETPKI